jgi:hypothetical protein
MTFEPCLRSGKHSQAECGIVAMPYATASSLSALLESLGFGVQISHLLSWSARYMRTARPWGSFSWFLDFNSS